ncbi:MAG: hypothetical protein HY400_00780 [Elusimicrobia bacterium]|nr:hypothetical protein [Elusimicrobiota bacterium]
MEKIKIRGLGRISGWMFAAWGFIVLLKAIYDLFCGEPESNQYSLRPWEFVARDQWLRYGGFELVYGLACLSLAWLLFRYSTFLPEIIQRRTQKPEVSLF